ncbi:SDR family NAD(P)-dependent oxidoreductase [Nonomuraea sp. CA-141351]|uniref:SDR family NAD(P)-dependent oxidoreductase n=1 Tax=Nonomuraea sp. CA-141351 TaxID=3239996 RepID=UPI003D8D69F6
MYKVALDFLTATWAVELAPKGVRVVSVAPGITATPCCPTPRYRRWPGVSM